MIYCFLRQANLEWSKMKRPYKNNSDATASKICFAQFVTVNYDLFKGFSKITLKKFTSDK